jgi:hypothetical protein
MTQEELNAIIENTPGWASEKTLKNMNAHMNTGNKNMREMAARMGDTSAADVDSIKSGSSDAKDQSTKVSRAVEGSAKQADKTIKTLIGNADPANAMAELGHEGAKLMSKATNAVTGLIPGRLGSVATAVGKVAGMGAVAATGIAVVYGKLLTEQEKYTRALIDYGSVAGDLDMYTRLRGSIRSLGMGFKEFGEITAATKPLMVSATGDVLDGQIAMSEFIRSIDSDKTFNDFGMTVQEQSRVLAQEAQTLYELGEIEEFNAFTKKRVMGSFEAVNKLAMFAGSSLGTTRLEALRLREEARSNVDFQMALFQNQETIKEKFGEDAAKNIDDSNSFLAILNEATFGTEFAEEFKRNVAATVGDFKFDTIAANNIPKEMMEKMMAIGPEVASAYIKLVEDTSQGNIGSEAEATERQRQFAKMIKDKAGTVAAFDPLMSSRNEIIAQAQLIPDSYFNADINELRDPKYLKELIDRADGSIDAVDAFSVTFQNIQELLSPGFETSGVAYEKLAGGMLQLGNTVSNWYGKVFGEEREGFSFSEILAKQEAENLAATLKSVNADNIAITTASTNQQITRLDETIAILDKAAELGEGVNPDGSGETVELTEEQVAASKLMADQMRAQKRQQMEFLLELSKKELKISQDKAQEAVVNGR